MAIDNIPLSVSENTEEVELQVDDISHPYYVGARAYVTQIPEGAIVTVIDKFGKTEAILLDGNQGDITDIAYDPDTKTIKKINGVVVSDLVTLSDVAISNDYEDLDNLPDIPTDSDIEGIVAEWVADNPESLILADDSIETSKYKNGSVTFDKLADDVGYYSRNLQVLRIGRLLDRFGYESRTNVLRSQSLTYRDGLFYSCGNYSGNTTQSISVWDETGVLQTSKTDYTELGHANSISATEDYLVIADGTAPSLHVVNRSTLAYIKTISLTDDLTTVYGVSTYNETVYVLGTSRAHSPHCLIATVDIATGSYSAVCNFNTTGNKVRQGFTVYGGYAYVLYNQSNMIFKIDLGDGSNVYAYYIPDGDGFFPMGECEDLFVMNGEIYCNSPIYYNYSASVTNDQCAINQIFRTDILKPLYKNLEISYMRPQTNLVINVDGEAAYSFNPTDNFTTIEEACHIVNYYRYGEITVKNIGAGNCILINGNYRILGQSGTRTFNTIRCVQCSIIVSQMVTAILYAHFATGEFKACGVTSSAEVTWSDVKFSYVALASCQSFTVTRSLISFNRITSFNNSINVSYSSTVGTGIRVYSPYVDGMIRLTKATNSNCKVIIYVKNNATITEELSASVVSSQSFESPIKNNSEYDLFKLDNGTLKLRRISDGTFATVNADYDVELISQS